MTAEERAEKLLDDHPIEYAVGYKHHSPSRAFEVIVAAIREAVAAEREACAALVEDPRFRAQVSFLEPAAAQQRLAAAIRGRGT